ncbi:MAG TPA: YdbH domain-containing protein [Sphingomicrobium sp.]|nr:YdbH domain-containing protein [Sphingomicrobium sp.]
MAPEHIEDLGEPAGGSETVRRRTLIWRRTQWTLIAFLAVLCVVVLGVWLARKPIANDIIARELKNRGVTANYKLDRIGLRTQQVSNLVLGDPSNPDLVARRAIIQMRIKWNGAVEVYRVAGRGVRLRGRVVGNRVSWGQLDKLLPPRTGKPFALPNLVVDLADTTISLATPYGPLGFALQGRGNLSGGFRGKLAAASSRLTPGACRLDQLRAYVSLAVVARRPHVVGPVGASRFECPASNLRLGEPRMEVDSTFSEAFGSFDGKGRLSMTTAQAGINGLAGVNSNLTFKGTPTEILGRIDLSARQARLAKILAGRTRIDGRYRLNARAGALTLVGDYGASSVALAPSLTAGITGPLAAAGKSPLGPIAAAISRGISSAARSFEVGGALRLINRRGGGAVRIETADVSAANGARVKVAGGDGVTYYWPSGKIRLDGEVRTEGGGLPTARIALNQPRNGSPISGVAQIAPYAAGGSRVALAPVRFAARRDGWTQVSTVALLDGPLGGGKVTGLRIPIDGRFGPNGSLHFGEGCIDARFASLRIGGLRLGPTPLPLCATGPAILYRAGNNPLAFGVETRRVRLRGQLGKSPFALDAAQARMLAQRQFEASGLNVRLGQAASPVLINIPTLSGSFSGAGISGRYAGADGVVGRVPLLMSDASGNWKFYNNALTLDGGLTVADKMTPAKFYPLRSDNMRFSLANDMIRAGGTLKHPESGTPISEVTITHRLSNGTGNALLDVPGIRFGRGLQPEELTRLTEGVIALVEGTVRGQGQINWAGPGKVASTGEFNVIDTNLAAQFGPVTGLNTTIRFSDLLGLQTEAGQSATVASINPGILVENGVVRYRLLPDRQVMIERGEWPFMGGRLVLQETILSFGKQSSKRLTFEVIGLDAKTFVDTMGFKEIGATGVFDGVLPMIFDEEGGRIVGGRLDSRPGGGTLSYNGVMNKANTGMVSRIVFDALRDLRFKSMIIRLDGYLAGEFGTRLTVEGVGLGNTSTQRFIRSINRIPFKFNVSIKGPFRALIATAKSFRDPQDVIADALPRPLDEVPGITVEVRRREEETTQTQTPVKEEVTVTPAPTK